MTHSLTIVLTEYLKYRKGNLEDYLFCGKYGNKLTTRGMQNAIENYNKSRGVNKTSVHLFRHTFAKNWILNGGDIFKLQKVLGHSSLNMVREYVNMFDKDLKQNFDEFNPLEKFTQNGKYISIEK